MNFTLYIPSNIAPLLGAPSVFLLASLGNLVASLMYHRVKGDFAWDKVFIFAEQDFGVQRVVTVLLGAGAAVLSAAIGELQTDGALKAACFDTGIAMLIASSAAGTIPVINDTIVKCKIIVQMLTGSVPPAIPNPPAVVAPVA